MSKAPLFISADLNMIPKESLDILTNTHLIHLNQDLSYRAARKVNVDNVSEMKFELWDVPELPVEATPVIVKKPEPKKVEEKKVYVPDAVQKKA